MPSNGRRRLWNPSIWAAAGGLIGGYAHWLDPSISEGSLLALVTAATGLGIGIDSGEELLSKLDVVVSSPVAIRDKLRSDFGRSPLRNWSELESAHRLVVEKLTRAGLASSQDDLLKGSADIQLLRRYLQHSDCWRGTPRWRSVKILQQSGPLAINATSHNTALQSALIRMSEDFGIPLKVDSRYWHGVEQVEAINNGNYADFAIIVDANVFLASHNRMAKDYRLLIPCCWQKHKIIRRRAPGKFDRSLIWYADGTSAQEQALLGQDIGVRERPAEQRRIDVSEIIRKVDELNYEEGLIAWEPLITLHGILRRGFVVNETPNYDFSTSLYCHNKLLSVRNTEIVHAFEDCLVAAWNLARINEAESFVRLLLGSDCRANFNRIKLMTRAREQ
jgi:hypothetical protein